MRGRAREVILNFGSHDFKRLSKTTGSPRERLRYIAFSHLQAGSTYREAAEAVCVAQRTVATWVEKYAKYGIASLKDDPPRSGRKPLLPIKHYREFKNAILNLTKTRTGGRIRGHDVVLLLAKKFGVTCSLSATYTTLHRVGFVWITGRSQHPKSKPKAQLLFKKNSAKKY